MARRTRPAVRDERQAEKPDPRLEVILDRVHKARNFDFRHYKPATLRRRIDRRRADRGCGTLQDYLRLLEKEPAEFDALISAMLIKVTSFYRDPEVWETLASRVVPQIVAEKRPGEEIRVWCAGCATGEEAFTIAIIFAEVMGSSFAAADFKVFGTDLDEKAVAHARHGVYSGEQVESVPQRIRERYFVEDPAGWQVKKEIRRAVVFGLNNLVSDAPISRLDLLICRNVFIYLDAALQKRVLTRFHYALRRNGVVVLGKSELIPFAGKIFEPVDLRRRIYRKNGRREALVGQDRLVNLLEQETAGRAEQPNPSVTDELHFSVLQAVDVPIVATTLDGTVLSWNGGAAALWDKLENEVVGKKLAALDLPGLPGELLIERTAAVRDGRSQAERTTGVLRRSGQRDVHLSIEVRPLHNARETTGLVYWARDVTALHDLEAELAKVSADRQHAYEALQTINEEMQSSNEELETTNEELQSANEELQTTNEELQSTNEELETTNEELQSTNAELDATNRELAARTEEMNTLGHFQRAIIRSLTSAVIVLDAKGRVKMWNLASERLLGVSEDEAAGQVLWTLHVPALPRAVLLRIRKAVSQNQSLRTEPVEYELPTGAKGLANVTAVPISDDREALGSVIIFEDVTRLHTIKADLAELKAATDGGGRRKDRS